jgi:hypothetical protein
MTREAAENEARSRVRWGDPTFEIRTFLLEQEFTAAEADELLAELAAERHGEIRRKGINKVVFGSLLVLVPVIGYVCMAVAGVIFVRTLGILVAIGMVGLWQALDGVFMLARPGGEQGRLSSDQY